VRFWDSSAVIPLCLDQRPSAALARLAAEGAGIVVWWGTAVECGSAFARLRRSGQIDQRGEGQALDLLGGLSSRWTEVAPGRDAQRMALRLVRLHSLRAADALQLAAALLWKEGRPAGAGFVSLDRRLREAAGIEGFTPLPARLPDLP